jgi:hypothetical protein
MERIELREVSHSITQSLDKTVLEVAERDLPFIVSRLSSLLIADQVRLGNPPTNIIVDNRGRTPITQAKRRVQAFFADKAALRRAVYEAWNKIQSLTRVATGRAAGSYELWFNEQRIGRTPAAVETYLDRFNPAKDYFRIVGPVLVYGRKVYWNPKGKPKFKKKTVLRTKSAVFKLVSIRGIMDQTEQTLRRRYRMLAITEDWVTTKALPKDGRTPGLWLGFKKKGTLLRRRM